MAKRKSYSEQFRRDALRLHKKSGKTMAEIERDLDLSEGLLSKWKTRYESTEEKNSQEETGVDSELDKLREENRRLKKELETVKEERELLKTYNRVQGTS